MSGELARLDDELRRAYDGDCWHGLPLREILEGVAAATAAARHPELVRPIWGLVNHLAVWGEVVALRLVEWRPIAHPDAGDFPPDRDFTPPHDPRHDWVLHLLETDQPLQSSRTTCEYSH